jgi:hypothetical protein
MREKVGAGPLACVLDRGRQEESTHCTLGVPKGQSVGVAGASASRRVACPSTPVGHGAKLHCTARGELDSLNLRAGQVRRRVGGSFGMDADAYE